MSDSETRYVITGRVGGIHAGPAQGSDITECSKCHNPVWISPSSQKVMKENAGTHFEVICLDCAKPIVDTTKPEDVCPVSNGQLVEIANYFGISTAEASQRVEEIVKNMPELLAEYVRQR